MSLYDAIDAPVREPVALLSLLGCDLRWSCCGFHYRNEPEGKSHMIGTTQILMGADQRGFEVMSKLFENNKNEAFSAWPKWQILFDRKPFQGATFSLFFNFPVRQGDNWWNPRSPHFHEGPACAITHLVIALRRMENMMVEEVVLTDFNVKVKKNVPTWDFEPEAEPWVIRKADFFPEVVAEVEAGKKVTDWLKRRSQQAE